MFALQLTEQHNRGTFQYIENLLHSGNILASAADNLRGKINSSERTKYNTYRTINPDLSQHVAYSKSKSTSGFVPEYARISFSRMRLSSHRLRIETGRWTRLPRDQRLCECGAVQDEEHVLRDCPQVAHLRGSFGREVFFPDILAHPCDNSDFLYIDSVVNYFG